MWYSFEGPSFKKRVGYWCLSKFLRMVEVSVNCLELLVEDTLSPRVTLLCIVQVTGQLNLIAKPLPNKELVVSIDVEKASGRYYLQADRPCSTTEDGLYPLGEFSLSTKILIFLQPLNPVEKGLLHSVQINTLPLSITILHEDLIVYLAQHILSLLSGRPRVSGVENSHTEEDRTTGFSATHKPLPLQGFEVVLEEVNVSYQACSSNRVLSSKLTRVSLATKFSSVEPGSLCFNTILSLQGMTAADSLKRRVLSLRQILLQIKKASNVLSNELQVRSLHTSLWDGEAIFWSKHLLSSIQNSREKLRMLLLSYSLRGGTDHTDAGSSLVDGILALPESVVTTVEASDWSIQARTDSPELQSSKRPLVRGVMATCVGNIQWSNAEDHTSSIRTTDRKSVV